MVITQQKPIEELLQSLDNYSHITVLGCSECAALCETGGEEEVAAMVDFLEENGKDVSVSQTLITTCNDLLTKKEIKGIQEELQDSDAVLCLACGNGVQTLSKFIDLPIIPANNTVFVGERIRSGIFEENCRTCGECVLGRTAAICPISRCAKSLLNGPCGGSKNGKCEVDPDLDCAWILIYNRLKEMDKLDDLEKVQPLRDYSSSSRRRELNRRQHHE